jgi:hypothetical protein
MVAEITEKDARKVMDTVDAGLVTGVGIPRPGAMCVEAAVCYALGLPHGDDPDCVSRALRHLKIRLNDSNWSSDTARAMGLRRLALIQLGSRNEIDDKEFARRVAELAIRKAVPYALWCAAKIQKDPSHRQALLDAANRCEIEGTIGAADAAHAASYASYASYAADAAHAAAAHHAAHATHYAAYAAADAAHYAAAAASYAHHAAAHAASYAAHAASYAADAAASYAADAAAAQDRVLSKFAEEVVQILIDMKAPGAKWLWMTEAG